jgi:hypothetical protein
MAALLLIWRLLSLLAAHSTSIGPLCNCSSSSTSKPCVGCSVHAIWLAHTLLMYVGSASSRHRQLSFLLYVHSPPLATTAISSVGPSRPTILPTWSTLSVWRLHFSTQPSHRLSFRCFHEPIPQPLHTCCSPSMFTASASPRRRSTLTRVRARPHTHMASPLVVVTQSAWLSSA